MTMTMSVRTAVSFLSIVFLLACNEKNEEKEESSEEISNNEVTDSENTELLVVNEGTKAHVNNMLSEYYGIKTALVGDDVEKAKSAGQKLYEAIESFNIASLQDNISTGYKSLATKIQHNAEAISKVEDIDVQREHFASITDGMYKMVKTYDANEETVYYTYCPMAFNNEGGYWLSDEKEVKNPYFGSKMLKCGSVKETIAEN